MSKFNYSDLKNSIENLTKLNINSFVVGYSFLGEKVMGFHLGTTTGKQILVEGGIHAREYISTLAIIEEIKHLLKKELNFGVYFIPLVNPDGARLVLDGINFISSKTHQNFLLSINNSTNFSLWKANSLAVDLNSNFDALWGEGKFNKFQPSSEGFVGFYPNSEIENQNLINFVKTHHLDGSLSIHTKGEVVYYGYDELSFEELNRDKAIAEKLSTYLNFTAEKTIQSVGGFSDYISKICHIPSFTIELGSDNLNHPISPQFLPQIISSFIGVTEIFEKLI